MAKKHNSGIIERLTAIETCGPKLFNNFLPDKVTAVAKRVIDNDFSIFDELMRRHDSIQYRELSQYYVYCNNSGAVPMADNLIRHRIGLPSIPDEPSTYKDFHGSLDIK